MSRRVIGLDIGYDSVKAVYLRGKAGKIRLIDFWFEPVSSSAAENHQAALEDALKNLKKHLPKRGGYTLVTALSRQETMLQPLNFPFSDRQKLAKVARFDVEPYLPFPLDQVLMDFYVVESQASGAEIMVVSAPKKAVEERLQLLNTAKLTGTVVTLDGLSLAAAFGELSPPQPADKSVMILDVGLRHSTLNIVKTGKLRFSRSLNFGTENLGEILKDAPESEKAAAARPGEQPSLTQRAALREAYRALLREVNLCLQSWGLLRSEKGGPEKLYLTGGGSFSPDLAETLEEELTISVTRLNLLSSFMTSNREQKVSLEMSLMNQALALAWVQLKGEETASFNFLKERDRAKRGRGQLRQALVSGGVIAGLLIVLGGGDLYLKTTMAQKRSNQVDAQIIRQFKRVSPKTKRIVKPYQQLTVLVNKLEKKNRLLKKLLSHRSSGLGVLRDLSELIPPEVKVRLSGFLVDLDNIQLSGETPSFEQVERLKKLIEESPRFNQVAVLESGSPPDGNMVKFKIRLKMVESE